MFSNYYSKCIYVEYCGEIVGLSENYRKEINVLKIGIYTFWNVPNYGTFMQAYALQKIIGRIFPGDDVRQIAYLNPRHYKAYYGINQSSFLSKSFL